MGAFLETPLGGGVTGAIGVVLGVFVFGSLLGMIEASTANYVLGAVAGFVGGLVGAVIRRRLRRTGP